MTFAEAARRLAGQTALLLGWRPRDFWGATPAELAAIFAALDDSRPAKFDRTALARLMEQDSDDR